MLLFSDMWCGAVTNCPAIEGDDVTIGCYAQYDWLSHLLQYNPIVAINASLQFMEDPNTAFTPPKPTPPPPGTVSPDSQNLTTTYTFRNVIPGTINATCKIGFAFDLATAYSGRNDYAGNGLQHTCSLSKKVYCEYLRF